MPWYEKNNIIQNTTAKIKQNKNYNNTETCTSSLNHAKFIDGQKTGL